MAITQMAVQSNACTESDDISYVRFKSSPAQNIRANVPRKGDAVSKTACGGFDSQPSVPICYRLRERRAAEPERRTINPQR